MARFQQPSPLLLALEGRAWFELASLPPAWPWLRSAPRGDGHRVLVLPGWLASDLSTAPIRRYLRALGYRSHGWKLGRNRGPAAETIAGLVDRFRELQERSSRPVTLIGWSLGGLYARELARRFPGGVRQVITLASPLRSSVMESIATRFDTEIGRPGNTPPDGSPPTPAPLTALYSRTDGIVPWQSCLLEPGSVGENLEVRSSHCGIGHHPAALWIVADRLAQSQGVWSPFQARGLVAWLLGLGSAGSA